MLDVAIPRFPGARGPHYESYYVRAWDPAVPRAVWIRYTTFRRAGDDPTASLWVTAFEPSGVTAFRRDGLEPAPGHADRWIDLGEGAIVEDPDALRLSGRTSAGGHTASWDLRLFGAGDPWVHYPSLLYRAPLPRTKLTSPLVCASVRGTVEIDGVARTYPLAMVGHNWGAEHAHRWIWIHGADEDGNVLDLAGGRLLVGGRLLPWRLTGLLATDGERTRVGGLFARATVEASPQRCSFATGEITGSVASGEIASWHYADPSGGGADVTHSSLSTLEVRRGARVLRFAGAAYELGVAAGEPAAD